MIEKNFKTIRINFRKNGKFIIDHIIKNHLTFNISERDKEICVFCGNKTKITKEHVIPKWCFNNDPKKNLNNLINGSVQTYIKTTIPTCSICNNEILSKIEKYIKKIFTKCDLKIDYYQYSDILNVIRWLEIIDYKFQILNFIRKFIKEKNGQFIPFVKNIPISVMRSEIQYSPYKAISQLRASQKRILLKKKESKYFSLVFIRTKNKNSFFFHKMDEYIFFEFPEYQIALFYFFNKEFKNQYNAIKAARSIIKRNYS